MSKKKTDPEPGGFGRTVQKIMSGTPGMSKLALAHKCGLSMDELEKLLGELEPTFGGKRMCSNCSHQESLHCRYPEKRETKCQVASCECCLFVPRAK